MAQYTGRDLAAGAVSVVGAHDFDFRPEGVSPRRLPAWTRAQLPTVMDPIVRMPSGVRLVFNTDSSRIALSAQTTRLVTPPAGPRPAAFDLVVDGGSPRTWQSTLGNTIWLDRNNPESFRLERGPAHTVVWENLGSGRKQCELWLPHNAFVELRGLELDAGSLLVPVPEPTARRWAHYGSSISHCLEAESPTGIWPAVTASALGLHLVNYGFGGQCHLDQFMARTLRDTPADLISLKVGINVINGDTMRERVFADVESRRALEAILHPRIRDEVRHRIDAAKAPYVVVDIPLLAETGDSYRSLLDRVLVVECAADVRRERVMQRDGASAEQVDAMLAAQASDAARRALADDTLVNEGSLEELADRVSTLDRKYRMLASD